MADQANTMVLNVVGKSREVTGRKRETVPFTTEIFDAMSYGNQSIIATHEKFTGPVAAVGVYNGSYYPLEETVAANIKALGL